MHFASNTLNTSETHDVDELCGICALTMGRHDPVNSLQLISCSNKRWYHKNCFRKMAFALNDDFECPSCDNQEQFRQNMLSNGIYIPNSTYLPLIVDDDQPPQSKRKRLHKMWILESTFSTKAEAIAAVNAEKIWSYHYNNESASGVRVNYRCNQMKFRGTQCASGLYLLYDSRSTKVYLYRADTAHTHDAEENRGNAVVRISGALEKDIRTLFEQRVKPKAMLYQLVNMKHVPPKKSKLTAFLAKLRKEKFGSEKLHYGTLQKWLIECSVVPTEDSVPFIVTHEVHLDDENVENCLFRFFVSTKLLLRQAINVSKLHTDATYKLVWQGFPIIVIGTSDSNRKFHPFGVMVSTNERSEDFEFIFQSLKNGVYKLTNEVIDPDVLNCDAAFQIHNGFKKVYPLKKDNIIMCWAHLRRAVVKNVPKYLREIRKQNSFIGKGIFRTCVELN